MTAPPVAALRVLVVDDESLVRWSVGEALMARGHHVDTAVDAQAAVRLLSDGGRDPDVVLLDYRLPGIDGLALLPRIRVLAPRARVVMMTAYGSPEFTGRALALGAMRVVDKPIDLDDIVELVT